MATLCYTRRWGVDWVRFSGVGPANSVGSEAEAGGRAGRPHGRRDVHRAPGGRSVLPVQQQRPDHQAVGRAQVLRVGRPGRDEEGGEGAKLGLPLAEGPQPVQQLEAPSWWRYVHYDVPRALGDADPHPLSVLPQGVHRTALHIYRLRGRPRYR